jgi:hypothetical protein
MTFIQLNMYIRIEQYENIIYTVTVLLFKENNQLYVNKCQNIVHRNFRRMVLIHLTSTEICQNEET